MTTHLKAPSPDAIARPLCALHARTGFAIATSDEFTLDILQADCEGCLWGVAKQALLQLTATLGRLQETRAGRVKVVSADKLPKKGYPDDNSR